MKPNFKTEMDRTRSSVAEIVGWCLVVALNQEMGIGAKRLNRCAEAAIRIQEQYISVIDAKGLQCAMSQMQKDVADLCDTNFRVPLRRSARNRREQQLRIAGDQAATIEWCIWARAAHEVLGLGPKRLAQLRQATDANYRQFADWEMEDEHWAWDKMRRCVEAAMNEQFDIVDEVDAPEPCIETGHVNQELVRRCVQAMWRVERPAGWAVLNPSKILNNINEKTGSVLAEKRDMTNDLQRNGKLALRLSLGAGKTVGSPE